MEPNTYNDFLKHLQPRYDNRYDIIYDQSLYDHWVKGMNYPLKEVLQYLNSSFNNDPSSWNVYAGELPEIVITPDRNTKRDVLLTTYYPIISKYWATGHSRLDTPGGNSINVMSDDPDYNLLLNNCSDGTREALEYATGKRINPWFFTTPGDVRSFAENVLGGRSYDNKDGSVETYINLPLYLINKIALYALNLTNKRRLASRQRAEKRRLEILAKRGPYKNNNL